jgi:transcriptional regulator NrdR family protein
MQNCPKCKSRTDVYDSRLSEDNVLRRKRLCKACGFRYATIEVMDTGRPLLQVKERKPKEVKPVKPKVVAAPKPAKVAKPKKVRRFDEDDEYGIGSAFEAELYDVARDLGIGGFE